MGLFDDIGAALGALIPGAGAIIGPALGAIGLIQNAQGQRSANSNINQATNLANMQTQAFQNAMGAVNSYDPSAIAAQSGQQAITQGQNALSDTLKRMSGQFTAAGGQPTGDTAFQVAGNQAASNTFSPIMQQIQAMIANAPQQKLGALTSLFNAPVGQAASTYFNAAQMRSPSPDSWSGPLSAIMGAFTPKSGGSGLSTFSGDPTDDVGLPGDTQGASGVFYPSG